MKKFSRSIFLKATAFIVLVVSIGLVGIAMLDIVANVNNFEVLTVENYMDSNTINNDMLNIMSLLESIITEYKNEEYITEGHTIKDLENKNIEEIVQLYFRFIEEKGYANIPESEERFVEVYKKEIEQIKNDILLNHLIDYKRKLAKLNEIKGLLYYATDGVYECSNTNNKNVVFYSMRKAYATYDGNELKLKPDNTQSSRYQMYNNMYNSGLGNEDKQKIMYIGFTDEGLQSKMDEWNVYRKIAVDNLKLIIFCVVLGIISFIYLVSVAGKRWEDEAIHLSFTDLIYTDINVIAMGISGIIFLLLTESVLSIYMDMMWFVQSVIFGMIVIESSILLTMFMSIVKHIKNKTLFRHSFIYIVFSNIYKTVLRVLTGGSLMLKAVFVIIIFAILSLSSALFPPLIVVVCMIAIYVSSKKITKFKALQNGIKIAKEGNYDCKIELKGYGEFKDMADNINSITDGLKVAVDNEVRSERMKTELITNVSHDIKTPLTSIITYVDLLKREGLDSENAHKYLDVLERKSNRLRTLTEDLFEAANVTSGSIKVNLEKINLNSLISQIIGELDEKIKESELEFKVSVQEEKAYVKADGRLLCRVIENLMSNVLKYTLKGSRVYINITPLDSSVSLCIKNISAYELNIPVDELMERFKRGDESRNSEGNGLGLSIAKSLTEIQKGSMEISIDGDLFKAEISMPRYE